MCEVCAIFGIADHWTESAKLIDRRFPADEIRKHRGERRRRIAILNGMVSDRAVRVSDWDGEAFKIESARGPMRIVADLSGVWSAIEALSGRPFDPLTEDFVHGSR